MSAAERARPLSRPAETHALRLLTVGHGTAPAVAFVDLLRSEQVERLVDVRSFATSRRNPQFDQAAMRRWLAEAGIEYRWEPDLGGRRRPSATSPHRALRHDGFRGYADHMETCEFRRALNGVLDGAVSVRSVLCCSESLWWRCHRRLVADAATLLAGAAVLHLGHDGRLSAHRLTDVVRAEGDRLVYDGGRPELAIEAPVRAARRRAVRAPDGPAARAPDRSMRQAVVVIDYDEFSMFKENADEFGLPWSGPPKVERQSMKDSGGREISALVWGDGPAEIAFFHGGSQNAHTWDTVALALGRPLVAIDMPGHGRSGWRDDHDYRAETVAGDLVLALEHFAPEARMLIGMSMGGTFAIAVTAARPDLVRKLTLVDITPGTRPDRGADIHAFVDGPLSFPDFDAILARTIQHNPTRSHASMRRGVLHNARELPDGTWIWRYDRERAQQQGQRHDQWEDVAAIKVPLLLVRGSLSTVVNDDDVAELKRRQPEAEVILVEGSGHSIQGDRPLELTKIIEQHL